ncbi:hypothetical protein [Thalassotalea profundi]|nr:hypothetical protein [Thalassotalea profundi]
MKNKISRTLAITAAVSTLALTGNVLAETVNGTASVTVQNGFTLTQTTPLSFGTIVALADADGANSSDFATLKVDSDGVTADVVDLSGATNASIVPISAGTPGQFTVSGAAPNTVLTITNPSAFTLSDPSAGDSKIFDVTAFTNDVVTSGSAFTYDTDATGTLVFNIGATLGTDNSLAGGTAAPVAYDNVTFTGTYTMTVDY